MARPRRGRFAAGFFAGVGIGLATSMLLFLWFQLNDERETTLFAFAALERAAGWAYYNFGLSLLLFVLTAVLFACTLVGLKRRLGEAGALEQVVQADHLTDVWISLFFGIGVIWTAIGMRSALLYALGDVEAMAGVGSPSHGVLQRLVDGGILVALSSTILGGVGGYLMRIVKAVTVGAELQRYYDRAARSQGADIQGTLERIEDSLDAMLRAGLSTKEFNRDSSALVSRIPQ